MPSSASPSPLRHLLLPLLALVVASCGPGEKPGSGKGDADPVGVATPAPTPSAARVEADALVAAARALEEEFDYAGALIKYREAQGVDPNHPALERGLRLQPVSKTHAQEALRKVTAGKNLAYIKDFPRAYDNFRQAAILDPNNLTARRQQATAALEVRRFYEAMRIYDELRQTDPGNPEMLVNSCVAAYRAGAYDRCLEYLRNLDRFEEVAEKDATLKAMMPRIWFMRGISAHKEHRTPEAIDALQRAVRVEPDNAEFVNYLGGVYIEDGQYDLAIRSFRRVLEIDPGHRSAPYFIGRAYDRQGKMMEAIEWYRKSLERDQTNWQAYVFTARCYEALGERENLLKSLSYLDQALHHNPIAHEAFFSLAKIHKKLGHKEEAEEAQEKFNRVKDLAQEQEERLRVLLKRIQRDPKDIEAYLGSIDIHVEYHHWKDAMDSVRELLAADPDNLEGLFHMVRLLLIDKQFQDTYYEALKIIELAPNQSRGYTYAAYALQGMNRIDEALEYGRKAFETDASDFGALDVYMRLMHQKGGHDAELNRLKPLYQQMGAIEQRKLEEMQRAEEERKRRLIGEKEGGS